MIDVPRDFAPVERRFWSDLKVRGWASDETPRGSDMTMLALYLLTNKASSLEGFYELGISAMADDLQWTPDRVSEALALLIEDDFVDYDETARIVFVVRALKNHGPMRQERIINAAIKQLAHTQGSPRLFIRFLAAAERYKPEFAAAIRAHYGLLVGRAQVARPEAETETHAEAEM
jgi:hypothetical protein